MVYRNLTGGGPLTVDLARRWFKYNEWTGELYRIMNDGSEREVGTIRDKYGHRKISFNRRSYPTTYAIWLIVYGREPNGLVDHKNTNKGDDRLDNLRECTQSQNMANTYAHERSKTGIKGVSWDKARNKWAAYICKDYKRKNLGRFDSIEEAEAAYTREAKSLFGEFAR